MVKKFIKNLSQKGSAIKHKMERGFLMLKFQNLLEFQNQLSVNELASNKTTREMPGRLIAIKINNQLKKDNVLDKNGKILSITKSQVNRILRAKYGKPLKVRKVFYLDEEAKKKRLDFCKNIIQIGLEGKDIFFTDETRMDTAPNTKGESIRLSAKIKNQIKKGNEEGYKKINRQTKKHEASIIIAGGVSFYGLSDLILLNGTMTDFSYAQALEFYKEKYEDFKKHNKNLYFEQDGASCHTSKKIKALLEKFFGDKLIQNAPHSPDIAYSIETLWSELKKRVKSRNPKNLNELKEITIEEWNQIPKHYIKNLFTNFIKRCKKIIELNGARLEPEHLRDIRKEMTQEEENEEKIDEEKDNENDKRPNLKLKLVYSQKELIKKAKKEIALIRKKIKAKKKELSKTNKVYIKAKRYSKRKGKVIESLTNSLKTKTMRNIELENYRFKVSWIKNYISKNIDDYFNYFKKECERQESAKTYASTMDGEIDFKLKSKAEKLEIKRDQEFYTLDFHPNKKKSKK